MPVNYTRSWLAEMLEELERRWKPSFAWEDYGPLCERLTEIRTRLRQDHGVKNPRMFCRHCNGVHEMILAPVTIRSVLFALKKKGLLTETQLNQMDVEWRRYRSKHRLDGRRVRRAEPDGAPTPCDGSYVSTTPRRRANSIRSSR